MKLPQFLAKLSSKQIYGIFAFATVLFVIIVFVVTQNIQKQPSNYQVSLQNISNSSSNSVNSSSSYNSILSSGNPNSILTNSEVVSSSQNSNSLTNSTNSTSFQASSETNSQSFRDFFSSDKTRLQNLSQTLTKIDTSQKPFLLFENQLLDQKKQKLLPEIISKGYYTNPKPIYAEAEKTLYFPYFAGFIAKVNIETGAVKWDVFDFQISQMSFFGGKYYFTEYKKGCIGTAQSAGITNEKCKIYQIDRDNTENRKTLIEINDYSLYVAFANSENFWLTSGFGSAGEGGGISVEKFEKNGKFVEGFSQKEFGGMETLNGQKRWCGVSWIENYQKNPTEKSFEDKDKKNIWTTNKLCSDNPDYKGKSAEQDKTGKQIFQSKFPFDISALLNKEKPINCQKWQYKPKNQENNQFQLFYDNQELTDYEAIPINCVQ